jgi:predicted solute-binding protein
MDKNKLSKYEQCLSSLLLFDSSIKAIVTQNDICQNIFHVCYHYMPTIDSLIKTALKTSRLFLQSNDTTSMNLIRLQTYQLRPIYIRLVKILTLLRSFHRDFDHYNNIFNISIHDLNNTISFYESVISIVYEMFHNYTNSILQNLSF